MEVQDSNQVQDGQDGEVMESLGMPEQAADEVPESHDAVGHETTNDPLYVQKRLKQQKRAHEREIRDLHARMADMQSRIGDGQPEQSQEMNLYGAAPQQGGVSDQIHQAVSYALQQKDMMERKAKEAQGAAHVSKQYGELQKHLDQTSDKYDDFDDVVRGHDAPFTAHMRDAALLLPKSGNGSAGEVLYKLGKNPKELERIRDLHPLDQASEMIKLSHALMNGGEAKASPTSRPLGQIKSNPVTNSRGITDKTSVSELRSRMKSNWK